MIALATLFALCLAATLGGVSRWDGSTDGRGAVKAAVWALIMALAFLAGCSFLVPAYLSGCLFIMTFFLCFGGKASGNGGGIDAGTSPERPGIERRVEAFEWPLYLIFWRAGAIRFISVRTYDLAFLSFKGVASVSGAALAFGFAYPPAGLIVALGGALSGFAYALGWLSKNKNILGMTEPTQKAEAGTGAFVGLALALAVILVRVVFG